MTISGADGVPEEGAYTPTFLVAGAVALVGAAAVLRIPRRGRGAEARPAAISEAALF